MGCCSLSEKFICLVGVFLSQIDLTLERNLTFVDNLLKHRQLALRANQSCEPNETLHTYNSIVALLIVCLFVPLGSIMHPQESKMPKRFGAPGARMQAEWQKNQSSHHSPLVSQLVRANIFISHN